MPLRASLHMFPCNFTVLLFIAVGQPTHFNINLWRTGPSFISTMSKGKAYRPCKVQHRHLVPWLRNETATRPDTFMAVVSFLTVPNVYDFQRLYQVYKFTLTHCRNVLFCSDFLMLKSGCQMADHR